MRCPKCSRVIQGNRETCLYCGASVDSRSQTTCRVVIDGNTVTETSTTRIEMDDLFEMAGLPESMKKRILDTMEPGQDSTVTFHRTVTEKTIVDGEEDRLADFSLEKALSQLSKMKRMYENGDIEHRLYVRLAADKIEDYVRTLDPGDRAAFVLNGVKTSAFAGYLDDEMLRKLRASVLSV